MANIILDYDGTIHDCAKIYVPSFYIGYKYLTDNGLAPIYEYSYERICGTDLCPICRKVKRYLQ